MTLSITRKFRDNLHGSISVSAIEDQVIAHPSFQRLRRIKQTAFLSLVFPGASHTRFEHSLGVMHLAAVVWNKIGENQRRLAEKYQDNPLLIAFEKKQQKLSMNGILAQILPTFDQGLKILGDERYEQLLRLAALLHDVGHPPFSHSGERFLPSWTQLKTQNQNLLPQYLRDHIDQQIAWLKKEGKNPDKVSVKHEVYSLLIIDQILSDLKREKRISKKNFDYYSSQDIASILVPSIEPAKESILRKYGGVHFLLNQLVSGEFDVDRVDYLQRDSRECGVVYGVFDAGRIIDSLCLYFDPSKQTYNLGMHVSGLAAFEDYLRARQSMYLQVYFHKSGVAAEAMMQDVAKALGGWRLPARLEEFIACDEYSIFSVLQSELHKGSYNQTQIDHLNAKIRDVLFNRRLWRRVVEVVERPKKIDEKSLSLMNRLEKLLKKDSIPYEIVSSEVSLTSFKPGRPSKHRLMVLKKEESLIPKFLPIEDFVSSYSKDTNIRIKRLYVTGDSSKGLHGIESKIVELLNN